MSTLSGTGDGVGSGVKDRKRSAHWSDDDTTILLNHLLAHRDTGRTADNGFKPEIWREAAALLDRASAGLDTDHHASSSTDAAAAAAAAAAANMGGPKTPEACKSRWQRLQRDFRAVKEMEEVKGFEFDRSTWRLKASSDDWAKAEKVSTSSVSSFSGRRVPRDAPSRSHVRMRHEGNTSVPEVMLLHISGDKDLGWWRVRLESVYAWRRGRVGLRTIQQSTHD